MKKFEKRTTLPEFQLDDLALEDRRSKLLEFDSKRRSLARNRALDQSVRNTARNLAGYVRDRLYMCEQARRYVGLVRRRDTPLGEPLRKAKLRLRPAMFRQIWQRFLAFDGRWAVHSNIRRWGRVINKIKREAATVDRMLDRLRIKIDPDVRPGACLLEHWGANGTTQTSMSKASTAFAGKSAVDDVPSPDFSSPSLTSSSVGGISPADTNEESAQVSAQPVRKGVDEDWAAIAADHTEPPVSLAEAIFSDGEQPQTDLPDGPNPIDSPLAAPAGTTDLAQVNAEHDADAEKDADCQNDVSSALALNDGKQEYDSSYPTNGPLSPNLPVTNTVQMPAINFPPIYIAVTYPHYGVRGSENESGEQADRNGKLPKQKWNFDLDLNNLPNTIEFAGEEFTKAQSQYVRWYAECDQATEKQRICAVLHHVYGVPIMKLEKGLGIVHKEVKRHIEACQRHVDAQRLGLKSQKNRATKRMDGDWPK